MSSPVCRTDEFGFELELLLRTRPLPPAWRRPELFIDSVTVSGLHVALAGVHAERACSVLATGSAGSVSGPPLERAYFELLERAAIYELLASAPSELEIFDAARRPLDHMAFDEVFPESPEPELWQYSKSNGVAAGPTFALAAERALWELVERDCVLRSWRGETTPRPRKPALRALAPLLSSYELGCFVFPASENASESALVVAGIFAFPKRAADPLAFGFAARPNEDDAFEAAISEILQRLGFLWGEAIPTTAPEIAPTAEFHQEHFLYPGHHDAVRGWLAGARRRSCAPSRTEWSRAVGPRRFVDLTPRELRSSMAVVKALPAGEVVLRFGAVCAADDESRLPDIHPIA